jgi:glutaredoxin
MSWQKPFRRAKSVQQWTSWWTRLTSWWRPGNVPELGHLHFVVYTRRGCHLCSTAWQILEQSQQRHGFQLQAIDVDTEAELRSRYGEQVPVVTVNGKLRFRGAINRALLERLLRAERSRSESAWRRSSRASE